ncbi:hypothetical protein KKB99_04895 [bacterium]|nr:hypothetical protein [bacterium]MBU1025334.1 hypothetical protein [bacterium]
MTENDKKIDDLFNEFFKEEINRPVPDGFSSRLMERVHNESVEVKSDLLIDNLWIILMAIVLCGIVVLSFVMKSWFADLRSFNLQNDFVSSFKTQTSIWYQIISMICAGAFLYIVHLIRAKFQTDYS